VIEGLLRRGETLNVIAPSKVGKSWLMYDLAIAVALGLRWLDRFQTVAGPVLILDNELHGETIAHRLPAVAAARGISVAQISDLIEVQVLRGRLTDLVTLSPYFHALRQDHYQLVICDALYRFLPPKTDENDNGALATIYNQSGKSITDVGAGAGAQSRAADAHLILRAHKEPGAVVLDAAVRSWPPLVPVALRWTFPVWNPADDLDAADLKPEPGRRGGAKAVTKEWQVVPFVAAFVSAEPQVREAIVDAAASQGCSRRSSKSLLEIAEGKTLVYRWTSGRNRPVSYATVPQPEAPAKEAKKGKP
jgi:hypothetical protein